MCARITSCILFCMLFVFSYCHSSFICHVIQSIIISIKFPCSRDRLKQVRRLIPSALSCSASCQQSQPHLPRQRQIWSPLSKQHHPSASSQHLPRCKTSTHAVMFPSSVKLAAQTSHVSSTISAGICEGVQDSSIRKRTSQSSGLPSNGQ